MPRLIAFGNNAFGNLEPSEGAPVTLPPTDITSFVECDEILRHNYSTTIGRDSSGHLKIWGEAPVNSGILDLPSNVKRFLGLDNLVGYILEDGYVYDLQGNRSALPWDDVVVSGLGQVFTYSGPRHFRVRLGSINVFQDLHSLLKTKHYVEDNYDVLFGPGRTVKLYAAESRVFILVDGTINHLYEIDFGSPAVPGTSFRSKEALGGLRVSLVAGSRNRFAAITDAGDFYIMDTRSRDPELVELPEGVDGVRLAGLGSKFEVIVTEDKVFVRGSNDLGELGLNDARSDSWLELEVPCDPKAITAIHTSRSSTILEVS